jgi:MtN3 and saliva related transmembrane protein
MNSYTIIGILASTAIAISLIPQLIKLVKEKDGQHLSVVTLVVMVSGSVLWIWYGLLKKDLIIIISNSVSVAINCVTLALTLKYKKAKGATAERSNG